MIIIYLHTICGSNTRTVSHIDVHTGVSDGFPTQPLLSTSTNLNCSVTLHPHLNLNILTIQYQWYSNGLLKGNGQELMLPNLSPVDAAMYSCNVTISSADPTVMLELIKNASIYCLTTRRKIK